MEKTKKKISIVSGNEEKIVYAREFDEDVFSLLSSLVAYFESDDFTYALQGIVDDKDNEEYLNMVSQIHEWGETAREILEPFDRIREHVYKEKASMNTTDKDNNL